LSQETYSSIASQLQGFAESLDHTEIVKRQVLHIYLCTLQVCKVLQVIENTENVRVAEQQKDY